MLSHPRCDSFRLLTFKMTIFPFWRTTITNRGLQGPIYRIYRIGPRVEIHYAFLVFSWNFLREGFTIKWPLKWQFHDFVISILTSRTAVSEVVKNVSNVVNIIYGKTMVGKRSFFWEIKQQKWQWRCRFSRFIS